jgi:cytidylate kinase
MNKKYIITIGRQFGSRGKEIGLNIAQQLGIKFYDKELITRASKESGLCPEFFENADEKNSGSLAAAFAASLTMGGFQYKDFFSNEKLFEIQSEVIRKIAEEESAVIVGRCADYILREYENCNNLFIHAPLQDRVKTIMSRENVSEKEALDLANKTDKTRASYYNYYTDKIWGASASYHLSIDSSLFGVSGTVDFICDFIQKRISL